MTYWPTTKPHSEVGTQAFAAQLRSIGQQGWIDSIEQADAAVRRERRPLPPHDLNGVNYLRWATAVLQAEVNHAQNDSWRCITDLGVTAFYDRWQRGDELARFRFRHEELAGIALLWRSSLISHDNFRHGPSIVRDYLERWNRWDHADKVEWLGKRRALLHGFLTAAKAYQQARAAIDRPTSPAACRRAA